MRLGHLGGPSTAARVQGMLTILLAGALITFCAQGCKHITPTDTRPLDQAGMWFNSLEELRKMKITDAEVMELAKVRQAGVSDAGCLELMRLVRSRNESFANGESIAGLRRMNVGEDTILELARLHQVGSWAGQAQALRLAGLSDNLILAVAHRRAAGRPVMSGAALLQLRNMGMSEAQLLKEIGRGTTDEQATQMVAAHRRYMTPSGFVHQRRRGRR